jgi:2-oxoglutarate ferredoxin oxidoreductase subunit alpha
MLNPEEPLELGHTGTAVCLLDGSRLIVESLARAGADVFVGYPITPTNLVYNYSFKRLPDALAAPDEISVVQWMSGFAAAGRLPFTATSFPGFALMVESLNMAVMMELPMVVVLAQRLGPATGTATGGAQGDILLLQGMVSGGHPVPVLSINSLADCWTVPARALHMAARLRTPVVVLTSKEQVMTQHDCDVDRLPVIAPVRRRGYLGAEPYVPYEPGPGLVPEFVPVGDPKHQVRLNASTHDRRGILQHSTPEGLANTARLEHKVLANLASFTWFEHFRRPGADTVIVAYGVTAQAARRAVLRLAAEMHPVDLFMPGTLLPVPPRYVDILAGYRRVIVVEENLSGLYARVLYGAAGRRGLVRVNSLGRLVSPADIVAAVKSDE